ncbi:MAG: lysophospholipid acyltransferase family protein [Anaerolineales bacterium]
MRNFVRGLIRFVFNRIARFEIHGYENVPSSGAFVLAVNHIGVIDIAMFHYIFDRFDMFIPVGEKWEKNAFVRWLARNLNFLFVDRFNPDLKALRKMIALMDTGNSLVIAPEGTRSKTGALIEGKPGVAYLAARSGFPVLPVAITGTEDKVILGNIKRLRKSPVTLTAGKPFTLPPIPRENRDETLQTYTDEIMCQIAALLPERYRGVYAEHPRLKALETLNAESQRE